MLELSKSATKIQLKLLKTCQVILSPKSETSNLKMWKKSLKLKRTDELLRLNHAKTVLIHAASNL